MIDSHCHLDHEPLKSDLHNIIKRAKETGITKLLTICTTIQSFENIIEIIKNEEKKIFDKLGSEIFNFTNSLKLLLGKKIRVRLKPNDK